MSPARTNNGARHQTRGPIKLLPWADCGTLLTESPLVDHDVPVAASSTS